MTRVVFVVGMARSGSTLLTALLNGADGLAGLGEVHVYWEIADSDRKCGCGRRLAECPVWSGLRRALEREGVDPTRMRDAFHAYVRPRPGSLLRRLRASRGGEDGAWLRDYAETMERAYRELAAGTGAEILVDSSKLPAAADLMSGQEGLDVRLIHLVRDPRAVAHSLARRGKTASRIPGVASLRYLVAALRAGLDWLLRNAYIEIRLRRRSGEPYELVRFEDLTASPRERLDRLLAFCGAGREDGFLDRDVVVLGENHILTGDASRFDRGEVKIAPQDSWRTAMPLHARLATSLIALPLLRRYGYRL